MPKHTDRKNFYVPGYSRSFADDEIVEIVDDDQTDQVVASGEAEVKSEEL